MNSLFTLVPYGFMPVGSRLLSLLQLTRMALVFTAIADSLCSLLLWGARSNLPVRADWVGAIVVVSIGLYGFGMSLNDIVDRRRDAQLAAHRPLPSGRLGVLTAHVICGLLVVSALLAAAVYARQGPGGWISLVLAVLTAGLIVFYDFAGKYLVAPGLLVLGLIRFFHAAVAAPSLPMIWQPLLLLNHVVILSTIAYDWEEKRPALTRLHRWSVFGGLACIDLAVIVLGWWRGKLWITPGLLMPLAAAVVFVLLAGLIRRRSETRHGAGQTLMLTGLLWLIVYDAVFAGVYVSWRAGCGLLLLLPTAYLAVQLMRWWTRIVALSQRPTYKRAE